MNENGQFVVEPDNWAYVENESDISESSGNSENEFEIQVTFDRLLLIFAFELYMRVCGCSFPFFAYALRTLAASMILGLTGLLISCIAQNTISGYFGSFCLYFVVQMIDFQ
jgi:hypothetical protein